AGLRLEGLGGSGRCRAPHALGDGRVLHRRKERHEEAEAGAHALRQGEHRESRARALRARLHGARADRRARRRRNTQRRGARGDRALGRKRPEGRRLRIVLFFFSLFIGASACAQYPGKTIHIVVPSPPGGPPDLIARMIAPRLQPAVGQPIIVENRAGAGGIVGTAYVAKQPPDGVTWLLTTASHVNTPPFNENVPFDPVKDFSHVTLVAQNYGQALIVSPGAPFKTVKDLIEEAKRHPGKLNYAHAGIGTASHIPAELMKSMAGVDIVPVPYKGVAEAILDVISGRMDMFFVGTQLAAQHEQTGKLRILALT